MNNIPQEDTPHKRCSTCKMPFPATSDFFVRDMNMKDGLYPSCKACRKVKYEANKESILAYHRSHQAQATEHMRHYRHTEKNKAYRKKHGTQYYQEHRDEMKAQAKQNYELHRDEINDRRRQFRKSHPDLISEVDRAHRHKRRAQKLASGGSYTAQDIQGQHERQKGKCYWCHKKLVEYHIDHVIPLSRGGSNDPDNLVLACPDCNMRKHDKLPHEWPEGGRLL